MFFTFGNHMHWVDMQWLWGYDVLPGSVADMLGLIREAGVKGNVNFDAVGYERMAAECPGALADLREAVKRGEVEPVGCSYGQPYGLFHGGESNIRQLTFGVRATLRMLGVRPRAFWEEEFYFFPQLPQMLSLCGYTGACLFFQWTWHTPEIPKEIASLIRWEGIDGSRLSALPRNDLNLHQWPEDFEGLLNSDLLKRLESPAIVQWLELMPSKDWMCRSELLLPRLKELLADERLRVRPGTLSEVISAIQAESTEPAPVRRYGMDQVWHGMTLGKNADRHPRTSRRVEHLILAAESLAATVSLLGRPYPSWDVYPTWELDEAWRELLAAQHHDNHECEGLCGSVAYTQFEKARAMVEDIIERTCKLIASRLPGADRRYFVNRFGWPTGHFRRTGEGRKVKHERAEVLPAFGIATDLSLSRTALKEVSIRRVDDRTIRMERGSFQVDIDAERGLVTQIRSDDFPNGLLAEGSHWLDLRDICNGIDGSYSNCQVRICSESDGAGSPSVGIFKESTHGDRKGSVDLCLGIHHSLDALVVDIDLSKARQPDGGINAALSASLDPSFNHEILADAPYSTSSTCASGSFLRKYPSGDWMTSPQWFETVARPFTAQYALTFADSGPGSTRGFVYAHDGAQQFVRTRNGVKHVLHAYDPWDEDRHETWCGSSSLLIWPFAQSTLARIACVAAEHNFDASNKSHRVRIYADDRRTLGARSSGLPPIFSPLGLIDTPNVLVTAFHREAMKAGENLPDWVGHEFARRSKGACTHPFVIRMVEYDGKEAEVTLLLTGPVACAAKTNLLGEIPGGVTTDEFRILRPKPAEAPGWAIDPNTGMPWLLNGEPLTFTRVRFRMRPREIATVYADMTLGRKEFRDLDAKREVWATIHRAPAGKASVGGAR